MSSRNPSGSGSGSAQPKQQQYVRPPNPNQSSGRGFIPHPMRPYNSSNQTVTVVGYPPRSHQQQQYPTLRGLPVSSPNLKVAPSPSRIPDSNGYKHSRDDRDETIGVVRDRKVRITEGASLYALCRSWLRNGSPEESQPHYGDGVKSLPKPLPMPTADANVAKEKEGEEDDDETDEDENVDRFSEEDLLRKHVQRAKQIRARLSDERAKRIERYKTRLSLLLPPLVEQSRNDAPAP